MTPPKYGPQVSHCDAQHAEKYRGPSESFEESMNRCASRYAPGEHYKVFRDILLSMRFMPGGRIQSAHGTAYNCFVSGTISDSLREGEGAITQRLDEALGTLQQGGGIGYDFSTLRPRGAEIKRLGTYSSGPITFMHVFDAGCGTISAAGHRRGAQMGVLRVDHPDIEEFIHCKQTPGSLTNFNISIAVTDEFMEAVKYDHEFWLRFEGKLVRPINARTLWETVMRSTWDWAEPGVIFIDRINKWNNLSYCETIAATNPCFTGDTKVWTAEYGPIEFARLVGKTVEVLTETREGKLVYREMSSIRKTLENAPLVKVTLDTGAVIRCTPSHRFYLKSGSTVDACRLQPGQQLQSVYRYKANQKGYMRLTNGDHQPLEHHVPFEVYGMGSEWHAHHVNEVRDDNRPSNLELMTAREHMQLHMRGDNNPARRYPNRNPMKLDPDCTRGEKNGRWRSDLSTEEMLSLRETGMSYAAIAEEVGCSKYTAQKRIKDANHRVVSVEYLDQHEDVFCGTVDDPGHRFFIATGDNDGVLVANCGEQPLSPYAACLLGSFNLTKYVEHNYDYGRATEASIRDGVSTPPMLFDFEQFARDIPPVVRAMDRVVDVSKYPLPQQEVEAKNKRRMGLGITGLANAGEALGFPYGSKEFIEFEERVLTVLRDESYRASVGLAKELGPFPVFDADRYLESPFIQTLPQDIQDGIREHGIRNSHLLSIAPTGTISLCADNISSGIEPVFSYTVDRTIIGSDQVGRLYRFEDYGYRVFGVRGKLAADVTADEHLAVLATAQRFVDSAVSKTCNVTGDMPWEEFKSIYFRAWEMGCKGITTYNSDGKRGAVITTVQEGDAPKSCRIDEATGRQDCD